MIHSSLIPIDKDFARSLNGNWRFKLEQALPDENPRSANWCAAQPIRTPETFEPFYAPDYHEDQDWHDFEAPGTWEMAGYSPATYNNPDNSSGFFRTWIDTPADWAGRIVKINFDGVMCGTEIWLNGEPVDVTEPSWGRANYHESGWTAWQADLTPQVKFGEKNLLALRVTKNTRSSNLDSGDYFFLGGVYRPVTLFSVPKTHIEDLTITTPFLPDGKAEVRVILKVTGGQSSATMRLGDFGPMSTQVGADGIIELVRLVAEPKLWSAEHPNLYPLTIELKDSDGRVLEILKRRVGIREITIEKGIYKINGVAVKMTGICRHDLHPSVGTAVGPDLWRKDMEMMKEANINAIRTSHYPYGTGFYDLCDEMGFYVLDELPYCWCPTDTPELTPAYLQRARETVRRDKNHACVVIWCIGNENKAGINQKVVADAVKELDPTRPRLNSERMAEENDSDFDDRHYTNHIDMEAQATNDHRGKWPLIYTENPNVWEVRHGADYGCLDAWWPVMDRCWDVARKHDDITGVFLWEWQDRSVMDKCPTKLYHFDPATGIQYLKTKGLVDGWRNPRPDLYHVKMSHSPIKIEREADLTSKPRYAVLDVTNRYDFTNLSEIKASWQLTNDGTVAASGRAWFDLAPRTRGKVEIRLPDGVSADALRVDFDHPGGWNVVTYQFALAEPELHAMNRALPEGLRFPRLNLVHNNTHHDPAWWLSIDRYRGSLTNVRTEPAISGDLNAQPLASIRSMDADIVLDKGPALVVGHAHAEYADGEFGYRVDWIGEKADIQELGWVFEMPGECEHFSWDRQAHWSYYPETHIGRPKGTALPDSADVHLTNITRRDAFDFNSTKYDCNQASLADAEGHGLRVQFAADQRHHVRGGFGADGAYELIVDRQCSPPRDISTNVVPEMYLELEAGKSVEGSFRIGSAEEV